MKLKKWLSHPLGSLGLLMVWLLLVDDFGSVGHWLLGSILALVIPRLTQSWWPRLPRVRSLKHLFIFFRHMLVDITVANFQVARLAIGPIRNLHPCWVEVPCDLDSEITIFLMASAISLAPGTVTTSVDRERSTLTVHALHCEDEQILIAEIKQRYEQPLKEAFACLPQ